MDIMTIPWWGWILGTLILYVMFLYNGSKNKRNYALAGLVLISVFSLGIIELDLFEVQILPMWSWIVILIGGFIWFFSDFTKPQKNSILSGLAILSLFVLVNSTLFIYDTSPTTVEPGTEVLWYSLAGHGWVKNADTDYVYKGVSYWYTEGDFDSSISSILNSNFGSQGTGGLVYSTAKSYSDVFNDLGMKDKASSIITSKTVTPSSLDLSWKKKTTVPDLPDGDYVNVQYWVTGHDCSSVNSCDYWVNEAYAKDYIIQEGSGNANVGVRCNGNYACTGGATCVPRRGSVSTYPGVCWVGDVPSDECSRDSDCDDNEACWYKSMYDGTVHEDWGFYKVCIKVDSSAECGNDICEDGEDYRNCKNDCEEVPLCGDGICNGKESVSNCAKDCNDPVDDDTDDDDSDDTPDDPKDDEPLCGDTICGLGEDIESCPADCYDEPSCGDGVCNGYESCSSCESDCGDCTIEAAACENSGYTLYDKTKYDCSAEASAYSTDTVGCCTRDPVQKSINQMELIWIGAVILFLIVLLIIVRKIKQRRNMYAY